MGHIRQAADNRCDSRGLGGAVTTVQHANFVLRKNCFIAQSQSIMSLGIINALIYLQRRIIMWATLADAEKVTLIGILITLLIGLCNLLISIHKNRVDFISRNRMQWIKEVREISSKILCWKYTDPRKEILSHINRLVMYLNISNSIDEKITSELLKMYDSAYKLSFYQNLQSETAKQLFENYFSHKQEFCTLIRIYLKKEWTRVKVESQIIKIPFVHFWIPIKGFNEKWATIELMKQYSSIKQYEFEPWIKFSPAEQRDFEKYNLQNPSIEDSYIFEDNAARNRRLLREALLHGDGQKSIKVPDGKLAAGKGTVNEKNNEEEEERRKLREALLRGDGEVQITQSGDSKPSSEVKPEGGTQSVPEGNPAANNYYWYERDPELFKEEVAAMNRQFPQFTLSKMNDGRLSWTGIVRPKSIRENVTWELRLVYDKNHPNNNSYGGSVRVYAVNPDLNQIRRQLGCIPHALMDPSGNTYICPAKKEDVRVGRVVTSAVSSLALAIKWIDVFESWLAGDVSTTEFFDHTF